MAAAAADVVRMSRRFSNVADMTPSFVCHSSFDMALSFLAHGATPIRRDGSEIGRPPRAPGARLDGRGFQPDLRSDLNEARISETKNSGCSHAAKCPPFGSLL